MKNLFNNINKVGLMVILFAAVLITTQSAFTKSKLSSPYYLDQSTNTWHQLTRTFDDTPNNDEEYDPNSYRCTLNTEKYCTGEFNSSASTIVGTAIPDGSSVRGNYIANP